MTYGLLSSYLGYLNMCKVSVEIGYIHNSGAS